LVPGLFLRLGRDQDCYDFIRLWEDKYEDNKYEREDVSLPWLELKDVDVFADNSNPLTRTDCDLAFTVAINLVKIRVLFSLENLQKAYVLRKII
jgi:hypothetical protein